MSSATDLLPGPRTPALTPPALPVGGWRRTTTVDTLRPEGPFGPAVLHLRARDLAVAAGGDAADLEHLHLTGAVSTAGVLAGLRPADGSDPGGLEALDGVSLRRGFARAAGDALAADAAARSLRWAALEDASGAYFVSGTVVLVTGRAWTFPDDPGLDAQSHGDVCLSWRAGGPQHRHLVEHGIRILPTNAEAPPLVPEGEEGSWHEVADLPEHSHRRARLLDVVATDDGALLTAQFRDAFRSDGPLQAQHEYLIHAEVDRASVVRSITVEAKVLPWADCPGAAASAQHLVGHPLAAVGGLARTELVGPTSCTHLTSTLRTLAWALAAPPGAVPGR